MPSPITHFRLPSTSSWRWVRAASRLLPLLLASAGLAAGELRVQQVDAAPGDTVQVAVSFVSSGVENAFEAEVAFDDSRFDAAPTFTNLAGGQCTLAPSGDRIIVSMLLLGSDGALASAQVCTLTFTVSATLTPPGIGDPDLLIPLTLENALFVDAQGSVLAGPHTLQSGRIRIPGPTAPGVPTGVSATAVLQGATVSFSPPASDGGSPITGYRVSSEPAGFGLSHCAQSPCQISGLPRGTQFRFAVSAINGLGEGAASALSNPVEGLYAPGAPAAPVAFRGNQMVGFTYSPPADPGNTPITHYVARATPGDATVSCAASAGLPCAIPGLVNGAAYSVRIAAVNDAGPGPESESSNTVVPATTPSPPLLPEATAGDASASVAFQPPISNGGLPILGYVATSSPGGISSAGCTASPCTVTGLSNGTIYTFTVRAVNDVGQGSASIVSNSVLPTATASPPALSFVPAVGSEVRLAGAGDQVGAAAAATIAVGSQTPAVGSGSATLGCSLVGEGFTLPAPTVGPITAANATAQIGVNCTRQASERQAELRCLETRSPGGAQELRAWPVVCPAAAAVAPALAFSPAAGDTISFDPGIAGASPPRLITLDVTTPAVGGGSLAIACSIEPAAGFTISGANQTVSAVSAPQSIMLGCTRGPSSRSASLLCSRTASPGGALGTLQWPLTCPQAVSQSTSTVKVGERLAPRGREVSVPVSLRGNGQTTRIDVVVQFDDAQFDFVRTQAVAPASCARIDSAPGSIGARQIRITTPSSNSPFAAEFDRPFCDIVLRPKATAVGGFSTLPVIVSTCEDGIGNNLACTAQAGRIGVNALETSPRPGSVIAMSGLAGGTQTTDFLLLRNVGPGVITGACEVSGNGFGVDANGQFSVPTGGGASVSLFCSLPANPDLPNTNGLLTCTTSDPALPSIAYALHCDARRPSEPVPEAQLRREALVADAQFGASGAVLPGGDGDVLAIGAPGGGSDFSGEVYLLQPSRAQLGKSMAGRYAPLNADVRGILSPPSSKSELPDLCFGKSIAPSPDGDLLAIGAPGRCSAQSVSTDPGRVAVFQRPPGGWNESYGIGFGVAQTIAAPPAQAGVAAQEFGAAVEFLTDGSLLVGAPGTDSLAFDDVGQVYLYRPEGGLLGVQATRIAPPAGGASFGRFGEAVAGSEDLIVIGAPGEGVGNTRSGVAYLVGVANGEPILPPVPISVSPSAGDRLGKSVLKVGPLIFVGAPGSDTSVGMDSGAVHVFRRLADGSALRVARLVPQPPPGGAASAGANQALGSSLSSNGLVLFVGAPDATEEGNPKQGRTYAYRVDDRWANSTVDLGDVAASAVLVNVGGMAGDGFGSAVVVGPNSAFVGAPNAGIGESGTPNVGRADLFGLEEIFRSGFER